MTRNLEPTRIVEEALREIADKAALLRYLTAVRLGEEVPDTSVLSGLNDVCSEIEELARGVKRSVPNDALMTHMRPEDNESSDEPGVRRRRRRPRAP